MKFFYTLIICLLPIFLKASYANVDSMVTLKVYGNCDMCKNRIEKSVKSLGILNSNWDAETQILQYAFQTNLPSIKSVEQAILKAGHDVNDEKAKIEIYENLPACCLYRDTMPEQDTLQILRQNQLDEIQIQGNKKSVYVSQANTLLMQEITSKELLKAACCNLSESFETNAAIDVSYSDAISGSKQIQLLGLSGIYTQLNVDNIPALRGLAIADGLNYVSGTFIESIQLSKGIGSVINGFEAISGQINVVLYKPNANKKIYINMYVNDFGRTDLNLNYTFGIGKKWKANFLIHDNFLNKTNNDGDNNGFRDLPTGNLFSIINQWQYIAPSAWTIFASLHVVKDDKVGGQVNFNPQQNISSQSIYGIGFSSIYVMANGKIGYVFSQQKNQSIGLQMSLTKQRQNNYFGNKNYEAMQNHIYANLMYHSILGNSNHQYQTGISVVYDNYDEVVLKSTYQRTEVTSGLFYEYTYNYLDKFQIICGLRADYNNLYGAFYTPRLHIKYDFKNAGILRLSAGRGQRTANIFAENRNLFASNREIVLNEQNNNMAYNLKTEVAWNEGVSWQKTIKINDKKIQLIADFFRTDFTDQVIVDMENARQIKFYNLNGLSFANSFQLEANSTLWKDLEIRIAYRFLNIKSIIGNQLLSKALIPAHRILANISYAIKDWKIDFTITYIGSKRIPSTTENPKEFQLPESSPAYYIINGQISKKVLKKTPIEFYIGVENANNFFQSPSIISFQNPFSTYFDASLIWGPVFGRMFYGGLRMSIEAINNNKK